MGDDRRFRVAGVCVTGRCVRMTPPVTGRLVTGVIWDLVATSESLKLRNRPFRDCMDRRGMLEQRRLVLDVLAGVGADETG